MSKFLAVILIVTFAVILPALHVLSGAVRTVGAAVVAQSQAISKAEGQ